MKVRVQAYFHLPGPEPGLNEICGVCGERYVRHRRPRCPSGDGNFVRSIIPAAPRIGGVETHGVYAEVCGRCGCSRGSHSTSDVVRCPSGQDMGGPWTNNRTFIPTGRYEAVSAGTIALDLQTVSSPSVGEEGGTPEVSGWIMVASSSETRLQSLCAAGIAASIARIVSPYEIQGIVFPETDLEEVKKIMLVAAHLVPTSMDGVRLALNQQDVDALAVAEKARAEEAAARKEAESKMPKEKVEYVVMKEHSEGLEYWSSMEPVLEKYAQKLKKNISVINAHNKEWDGIPPVDEVLRIVFWASVGGSEVNNLS